MPTNPGHRFSLHQKISNTGVLLHNLISACVSYMEWEVLGTSYKHGLDNYDIRTKERVGFAQVALELLQEIGLTKEELLQAWDDAEKEREAQ